MSYIDRDVYERMAKEFNNRGFYVLGEMYDTDCVPIPNGMKTLEQAKKLFASLREEYRFVAYKNMDFEIHFGSDRHTVNSVIFIKACSFRAELYPVIEIVTHYNGRMYNHVTICERIDCLYSPGPCNPREFICGIIEYLNVAVKGWWSYVSPLVTENRWPEEMYQH